MTSHCFTHVGTQFVPTVAFGDDAFGQALGAITTISLLNHFKDEFSVNKFALDTLGCHSFFSSPCRASTA